MAFIMVSCPSCSGNNVIKFGRNGTGKQRYQCKNDNCSKNTFLLNYSRPGDLPEVKNKIIEMTLNGSGIRDISRVLKVGINTVISEIKKKKKISIQ